MRKTIATVSFAGLLFLENCDPVQGEVTRTTFEGPGNRRSGTQVLLQN